MRNGHKNAKKLMSGRGGRWLAGENPARESSMGDGKCKSRHQDEIHVWGGSVTTKILIKPADKWTSSLGSHVVQILISFTKKSS